MIWWVRVRKSWLESIIPHKRRKITACQLKNENGGTERVRRCNPEQKVQKTLLDHEYAFEVCCTVLVSVWSLQIFRRTCRFYWWTIQWNWCQCIAEVITTDEVTCIHGDSGGLQCVIASKHDASNHKQCPFWVILLELLWSNLLTQL